MGFFDAIGKLGKAAVGTALLPVDVVREVAGAVTEDGDDVGDKVARRGRKIGKNVSEALDEIDE